MDYQHECLEENAGKFMEWIRERGGVAVWKSRDLSDPTMSVSTPALTDGEPTKKPTWKVGNEPDLIVDDPCAIKVFTAKEVKRFHVATRMGSNGLSVKVSEGGSRRIRREVEKAGEGAFYVFDYSDYDNAVIMAPYKEMSLADWYEGPIWDAFRAAELDLVYTGVARAFFTTAWADQEEEEGRSLPGGEDIMDLAPPTPDYVLYEAYRFVGMLEHANGSNMPALLFRAMKTDYEAGKNIKYHKYPEMFGHYLAMEAMGHGVSWWDDHAKFELEVPHFEFTLR